MSSNGCYTWATLLEQAGHPCCQVLEEYKHINLLSSFVHEIKPPEEYSHLEVIPLNDIQGKAVYVQLDNTLYDYVLKQPNIHDHNWCIDTKLYHLCKDAFVLSQHVRIC